MAAAKDWASFNIYWHCKFYTQNASRGIACTHKSSTSTSS